MKYQRPIVSGNYKDEDQVMFRERKRSKLDVRRTLRVCLTGFFDVAGNLNPQGHKAQYEFMRRIRKSEVK